MEHNMQKVECYDDFIEAKKEMNKHIKDGWKVYSCTMSTYKASYSVYDHVIVVYEQ